MSDKIERIIDALRKKILEEAIRGNLVPQNPEDEPASVLLLRIEAERERLIKEKKIKRPKSVSKIVRRDGHFYESINGGEPTCIDGDIPFDIPDSWEWVRLESICEVNPRNKHNEELLAGFIPMASVREGFSNYHDVNRKKWGDIKSGYTHLRDNDVMVAKITPCFQNRKSAIVANLPNGYGAGSTEFHIARTFDEKIIPSFLLVLFKSEYFIRKGLATFTGTAGQQRISSDFFSSFLVALPPTNEQIRLVRAVQNRLQALNDIEKSRRRHKRILSETPTSLRQQLIQAAIQGQLVPQNPNDEPANKLLESIAEERTAKLGKKAAKSMSRIERRGSKTYELFPDGTEKDISDEIPFEIPTSWVWARGKSIFAETKNGVPERDFSYIDIDAIDNKRHIIKSGKPTKKEEAPSRARRILESGDVLFSLVRPYLENIALVGKQHASSIASTGFYVVRTKVLLPDFTYSLFLSPYVIHGLNSFMKGDNSPSIRSENIEDFLYPIPPLPEQQRIVRALYKVLSYIAL